MTRWSWLLSAALAVSAVPVVTTAQADDKNENEKATPTSLDEIPAPARSTLLRQAGLIPIRDLVIDTEKGQTVYEGFLRNGKHVIGVKVDASGNVVGREVDGTEKARHGK
jgi:hypothetical protein